MGVGVELGIAGGWVSGADMSRGSCKAGFSCEA
jgi:hypothetical protein